MKEKLEVTQSFVQEFVAFIKGFGVIGLALGVVIGSATNDLVASLSKNIISPLIGLLFQSSTLTDWAPGGIGIGAFIDSTINFVILMFVIWLAVKLVVSRFLTAAEKEKIGIS
jgi:large conductance mechanosensitive channel